MLLPRSLLFGACLLPLLTACAKEKDASSAPSVYIAVPTDDLEEAKRAARAATVECANEGECDSSVGLLSLASEEGAGQCSASLISDDIAVTNSHCIPSDLKAAGSDCSDRLWLNFVPSSANPHYETRLGCEKIVYAAGMTGSIANPDFAYIKLEKKSARPTLRLSRLGFNDKENYRVHKVNPIRARGRVAGLLTSTDCVAVYNSVVVPGFSHPMAKVALLAECEIRKGNSGGPVVDSSGSLRGVISAYIDTEELQKRIRSERYAAQEGQLTRLNLATNFACLRGVDDLAAARLPGQCKDMALLEQNTKQNNVLRAARSIETEMLEALGLSNEEASRDFDWKLDPEAKGAVAIPSCVRAEAVSRYTNGQVPFRQLKFRVQNRYDNYARLSLGLIQDGLAERAISLKRTSDSQFQVLLSAPSFNGKIPLCP